MLEKGERGEKTSRQPLKEEGYGRFKPHIGVNGNLRRLRHQRREKRKARPERRLRCKIDMVILPLLAPNYFPFINGKYPHA